MSGTFSRLVDEVKGRVRIEDIAGLRVALKREGRDLVGLCPFHAEKTPSFRVNIHDNYYKCFGCGRGGDSIAFIMESDGLDFKTAVRHIGEYYGIVEADTPALFKKHPPPRPAASSVDRQAAERKRVEAARRLLSQSVTAAGTLVEDYLRSRAINPRKLPELTLRQLRFVPEAPYYHSFDGRRPTVLGKFPAMLAPMQDAAGGVQAVHMTYLSPYDGAKLVLRDPECRTKYLPVKKMRGSPWGCAVRLGPPGPTMQITEGIENGLSALMLKPEYPVWVAGSLNNIAGGGLASTEPHPVREGKKLPSRFPDLRRHGLLPPEDCYHAILVADSDGKDRESTKALIERAERRLKIMGFHCQVLWPPEGKDLNDVLKGQQSPGSRQGEARA